MKSLGLIEVIGFVSAVEASDTCLKAANVSLYKIDKVGAGIVTVSIVGDVGSVKAAVDAAQIAVEKIGTLRSAHVIPRLNADVEEFLYKQPKIERNLGEVTEESNDSKLTEQELTIEVTEQVKEDTVNTEIFLDNKTDIEINTEFEAQSKTLLEDDNKVVIELDNKPSNESESKSEVKGLKESAQSTDLNKSDRDDVDLSKNSVKELKAKIKTLDPSVSANSLKRMKKEELIELIDKLKRKDK